MSVATISPIRRPVVYPESDGKPMAENTQQFDYITLVKLGLEAVFADRPDVFVAGDLFWYPEEGNNRVVTAPDVMVVFGRPKGDRSSYLQWLEDDLAPQVVFEIESPSNTPAAMDFKLDWYDRHGVEEYYVYDPASGSLLGYRREPGRLVPIPQMCGWTSPRLGVRFDIEGTALQLFGPDGRRFQSFVEVDRQLRQAEAQSDALRAQLDAERQRAETERQRVELLTAKLRELGVDPAGL